MSCLFIKSTFSLEIIYSVITASLIFLPDTSVSTNGNCASCGQRVFRLLMCCRQSLLSLEGLLAVYLGWRVLWQSLACSMGGTTVNQKYIFLRKQLNNLSVIIVLCIRWRFQCDKEFLNSKSL
jgi:hypothetical protein